MGQSLVLAGQSITPSVLNRIYGIADTTSHTVNGTASAQLSTVYNIPAGDALTGTAYRITTFGNGTWGTSGTASALTVACNLAGTNIGITPTIAGTALSTSAAFDFEFCAKVVCVTTGSSGTWRGIISGGVSETANPTLPGAVADNTVDIRGVTHTAVTQDTTVADGLAVFANWTGTAGSPTLACVATIFEKVN